MQWYPGDVYVDWWGVNVSYNTLSIFDQMTSIPKISIPQITSNDIKCHSLK